MRVLLVAFALLLSGCTMPGDDAALNPESPGSGPGDSGENPSEPSDEPQDPDDPFTGVKPVSGNNATQNGTQQSPPPDVPNATEPEWGSPTGKGLRPGINMQFQNAGCTTSFLFHQNWTWFYLATAAHCVADGTNEATNGCDAILADTHRARLTLDDGGTAAATVIYSSWATMQRINESNPDACKGNDFALMQIDAEDMDEVHPASLHFQAPTGLAAGPTSTVYGYGASSLKSGIEQVHPKEGRHIGMANGGWSHHVYLATPGIPGDSGGHIMTNDGKALGVASTIIIYPTVASNHYTDIAKSLEYMQTHEGWAPELVTWDGWDPSLL